MSVSPVDFLLSAVKLAKEPDEISKRNAISRSYYAVFHLAHSLFPPNERNVEDGQGVHASYISYLNQHPPSSKERLLAVKLNSMRKRRVFADYSCNQDLKSDSLALQMSHAQELFNLLSSD